MSMDGGICQVCEGYHFEADEGLCPDHEAELEEWALEIEQKEYRERNSLNILGS